MNNKGGRPKTGSGKQVTVYLNRKRLEALGDDPVREIHRLIDEVYGVGVELKPVDAERIQESVKEVNQSSWQAIPKSPMVYLPAAPVSRWVCKCGQKNFGPTCKCGGKRP